jgi:hypothetical protein
MSENTYKVGHLLRSNIREFVVGSPIADQESPTFGGLVKAPLGQGDVIYGFVTNIDILDDGLVRQLVTGAELDPTVVADNRVNRTVPMEIFVLTVGYRRKSGELSHLLPPRAPLSLDAIHECSAKEITEFTDPSLGYLRHILRNENLPVADLIAAHVGQGVAAHGKGGREWGQKVMEELILLLRDDYLLLSDVVASLAGVLTNEEMP